MAVPQNNLNDEHWNNFTVTDADLQDLLAYLLKRKPSSHRKFSQNPRPESSRT